MTSKKTASKSTSKKGPVSKTVKKSVTPSKVSKKSSVKGKPSAKVKPKEKVVKQAVKKEAPKAKAPVKSKPVEKPKTVQKAAASKPSKEVKSSKEISKAVDTNHKSAAPKKMEMVRTVSKPLFPIKRKSVSNLVRPEVIKKKVTGTTKFNQKFLDAQNKRLLELRDHILDQMQGVAQDSLRAKTQEASSAFGMHQADAGSDAYEKDFALSLLSQEQDALYEIEEALKRLESSSYGICEMSGEMIPVERLEAIPFARYTVEYQSKFEKENRSRNRWETNPQFMDSAETFFDEEESDEEEDKIKTKE